jgi:hypothetical protein
MSNFTPGPWNFHRSYPLDSEVRTVPASENGDLPAFDSWSASVANGDMIIANVIMRSATGGWPHIESLDEARANARLIAAAPEMYEALKSFMKLIDEQQLVRNVSHDGELGWAFKQLDIVMTLLAAKTALAKADGEAA